MIQLVWSPWTSSSTSYKLHHPCLVWLVLNGTSYPPSLPCCLIMVICNIWLKHPSSSSFLFGMFIFFVKKSAGLVWVSSLATQEISLPRVFANVSSTLRTELQHIFLVTWTNILGSRESQSSSVRRRFHEGDTKVHIW